MTGGLGECEQTAAPPTAPTIVKAKLRQKTFKPDIISVLNRLQREVIGGESGRGTVGRPECFSDMGIMQLKLPTSHINKEIIATIVGQIPAWV